MSNKAGKVADSYNLDSQMKGSEHMLLRKLKLGPKIFLMFLLLLLIMAVTMSQMFLMMLKSGIRDEVSQNAIGTNTLALKYLDARYPGDWSVKTDGLYKGDQKMNGNNDVLDEIETSTGNKITLFQGNTRVATTVLKADGSRAVGTAVDPSVEETVLKRSEAYKGTANILGEEYQTSYLPLQNKAGETVGILFAGTSEAAVLQHANEAMRLVWMILAGVLLVSVVAIFFFVWSLSRRIGRVKASLEAAGQGDFTMEVTDRSQDEIGMLASSFNRMREGLIRLIQGAAATAEQVAGTAEILTVSADETSKATEHIAMSIQDISAGADSQLAATSESGQLMQDIAAGMNTIGADSREALERTSVAGQLAGEGAQAVQRTVAQMMQIHGAVDQSDAAIRSLAHRSEQIEEMVKVIAGIAVQTNLLALNAGIEAARAGESGRGFAVVAGEVKKLAEGSRTSAEKVAELISDIRADIGRTVGSMVQVKDQVNGGMAAVEETDRKFNEIVQAMREVELKVQETTRITNTIMEQVQEAEQTFGGLEEVARSTSMNTQTVAASSEEQLASMEEVSASSADLSRLADSLQELLQQFKVKE